MYKRFGIGAGTLYGSLSAIVQGCNGTFDTSKPTTAMLYTFILLLVSVVSGYAIGSALDWFSNK